MGDELPFARVPTEWAVQKLAALSDFITKGTTPTTLGFAWSLEGEGILFLRSECVSESGFRLSGSQYIPREAHAAMARSAIKPGDLLVTITGNVGRACMYPEHLPEANINQHIARVRVTARDTADPKFVLQVLSTSDYRRHFERIVTGLAYPQISLAQVRETSIALPPLRDQRKIAAILSSVDDAIEATQQVIDQLQVVKKTMMAEMLTRGLPGRHTRFKQTEIGEVPEEWEVARLDSLATVQTGIAKGKQIEGGVKLPYLRVANVQDGFVDLAEMKTIVVEASSVDRYRLRSGDVLFTEGGDADKLGRGCVWRGQIDPCLHQNHVFSVRPNKERLRPEFLALWAASPRGKAYFLDCAKQTTNLASINSTQLKALPVPLPNVEAQDEVIGAISSTSDRLDAERTYQQQLSATKSALMSVLLTGEVRVTLDEAAAA